MIKIISFALLYGIFVNISIQTNPAISIIKKPEPIIESNSTMVENFLTTLDLTQDSIKYKIWFTVDEPQNDFIQP